MIGSAEVWYIHDISLHLRIYASSTSMKWVVHKWDFKITEKIPISCSHGRAMRRLCFGENWPCHNALFNIAKEYTVTCHLFPSTTISPESSERYCCPTALSSVCQESVSLNRPISQISLCICHISHNTPFGTEMCTFLFWMVHCEIWTGALRNLWIWSIYITSLIL